MPFDAKHLTDERLAIDFIKYENIKTTHTHSHFVIAQAENRITITITNISDFARRSYARHTRVFDLSYRFSVFAYKPLCAPWNRNRGNNHLYEHVAYRLALWWHCHCRFYRVNLFSHIRWSIEHFTDHSNIFVGAILESANCFKWIVNEKNKNLFFTDFIRLKPRTKWKMFGELNRWKLRIVFEFFDEVLSRWSFFSTIFS